MIMSMYDERMLCMDCIDKEKKRPDYKLAEAKDLEEYAARLTDDRQRQSVFATAAKLRKEYEVSNGS